MRRFMIWLAASTVAFVVMAAPETGAPEPRTISVSGSAVGFVPFDTVLWEVALETTGKDLLEAKSSSELQLKNLVDACSKKGIEGADVVVGIPRIQDESLSKSPSPSDSGKPFTVKRLVTLRQRDARQFTDLLEMLGKGRNLEVHYKAVSSQTEQVTKDVTVKATLAAKEKATAMANALGAKLGNALMVNEYPPADWCVPDETVPVDKSSPSSGADAEKVRITVFATFEIQ